jgi:hypothetical protein
MKRPIELRRPQFIAYAKQMGLCQKRGQAWYASPKEMRALEGRAIEECYRRAEAKVFAKVGVPRRPQLFLAAWSERGALRQHLFCPACTHQHVDPEDMPAHASHCCDRCGHTWTEARPSVGVRSCTHLHRASCWGPASQRAHGLEGA